jgi:RNA polymerase sigma factor (sigma-70 family)
MGLAGLATGRVGMSGENLPGNGTGADQVEAGQGGFSAQLRSLGAFVRRRDPRAEVEDILQEATFRWLAARLPFDEAGGFSGPVAGFASNVAREGRRRRARTCCLGRDLVLAGTLDREVAPHEALEADEALQSICRAILQLRLQHRQIIVWHCIQKHPLAEVAERLGKTVMAARSTLHRARVELNLALRHTRRGRD